MRDPTDRFSNRPVILAVDDDPAVLRAVARDLRHEFGDRCRIVGAESGPSALDLLAGLAARDTDVAVIVADQRMPGMSGLELLARTREGWPDVGRVLLTAYADPDAALDAAHDAALDRYLLKPWDPPEAQLYPVVDELLASWWASRQSWWKSRQDGPAGAGTAEGTETS